MPPPPVKEEETPLSEAPRNVIYAMLRERATRMQDLSLLKIKPEDVFVVWFCKTLQNWKGLVGSHALPGEYFEVTFDGDKQLIYVDCYKKMANVVFEYQATPVA